MGWLLSVQYWNEPFDGPEITPAVSDPHALLLQGDTENPIVHSQKKGVRTIALRNLRAQNILRKSMPSLQC
jgi:acid phosphatase class B